MCMRFSLRRTIMRRARVGVIVGLAVVCCGVICGAADTVTGSFSQNEKTCSNEPGEGCTESESPTIAPTFEDTSKAIHYIKEVITIAGSEDITATESVTNLERLIRSLKAGKVRAGVVGLTNSGKSTFLNAILGRKYLPSSIQPQTAKEVSITHTPDTPGELLACETDTNCHEPIAMGWEAINVKLAELNTEVREGNTIYQKLSLRAPILLLNGVDTIKLEISDTPGLYEAAAGNATLDSELAVKEMSAFIMILNLRLLKLESEAAVIKALIHNHPTLFSKLSRVVVLVNAYDVAFFDDSPGTLKPSEITQYVADYLQDPDIIGINIPPEQIIPFSAKWALNARMWSADPAAFLEMEHAKLLYDEAVILLQRASYKDELKPFEQATPGDIKFVCSFLLEFSHIGEVEKRLKSMLHKNGPAILLDATVDDSVAEIATLFSLIDTKIKSQNIQGKEALFSCHQKLLTKFNEFESRQVSAMQPPAVPSSEINSITETLRGTFTSKFSSIFQNHLVGFHMHKDRNAVFNRICGVKPLLTNPANAAMRDSWNSVSSIVRQRFIEHSKSSVASMKTSVVTVLTSFANDNPLCGDLTLKLSNQLSSKVDSIDSNALVPGFPGLPVQVDANSIRNDRLNHIKTSYETEWTTTKHRKRKATGLFNAFRKKVTYYSSTSHQAARYSPDITAVQNALSTEGTNPWTTSFRGAADSHISSMANKLVETLKNTKRITISSAKPELTQAVEKSRQVLETSRDAVNRLTASKDKLLQL